MHYTATIYGRVASKSNTRKQVKNRNTGRIMFIKSDRALQFQADALKQAFKKPFLEGDLRLECDIYYDSRRPDLDESLIMDILEGLWYKNDRAIRHKIIKGFIDKKNPRVVVTVTEIEWDETNGQG